MRPLIRHVALVTSILIATGITLTAAYAVTTKPKPDPAAKINEPRADARTLRFDATEATWSSLDISPDGRTIVFDLLGDLYTMPIDGGTAKALTHGPAYDREPRYSPDGRTIVFTSDRSGADNLWLVDADGQHPRALTAEKDGSVRTATWLDADYVIGRKEDGKRAGIPPVELWIYHRDGGAGIKLTNGDEVDNASGAVASRDGRSIYYSVRKRHFDYVADFKGGLWQVVRYDRTLAQTFPVTSGSDGGVRPALSPDGHTLVYLSRRDGETVFVARELATGAERILARGVTEDEQEGFANGDVWPGYAFTPDGTALVYFNHGHLTRLELKGGTAKTLAFHAPVEQSVAPRVAFQDRVATGPVAAHILRWPNETPDGHDVAFEAFGRIWLQPIAAGAAQGAPRRLTTDRTGLPPREYAPAVSPDGQWVAYVSWSDAEGGHVWKAPVGGGEPVRLTQVAGHYLNPAWSPSGEKLALVRGSGLEFRGQQPEDEEEFELDALDARGGALAPVTTVHAGDGLRFHPLVRWSAAGDRLYFREGVERKKPSEDLKNDLVSVRLDGSDRHRHLRFPAATEFVPSPDERWVAFTSRDNVYLTALPAILTRDPAEVGLKDGALPTVRLSGSAGRYVGWAAHGSVLTWGAASTYHRLPLSGALEFLREERRKADAGAAGGKELPAAKAGDTKTDSLHLPPGESIRIAVTLPRATPTGSFVLRNARVVTMQGDRILDPADVLVSGNRIAAVGAAGALAIPAGTREFDARGKTVIPGLIDTHAHLHYSSLEVFPERKWEYWANLAYGVTTVYDPSAPSTDVFAQADQVEAGTMVGPRVYSSGDVLYGGQQTEVWAEVDSLDDARRQVQRMKDYGARMIKVYQQPRRAQRIWFAEACREEHMLLTAEGAGEISTDMSMVLDGYTAWEHALPTALSADVTEFVARSGTYYTPTLLVAYGGPWGELYFWHAHNPHDDAKLNRFVPHDMLDQLSRRHPWVWPSEYRFPEVAAGAAAVLRSGGHVSLGAHGQLQGLGPHWEIWAMAGEAAAKPNSAMTPFEALRASTMLAADKIGLAADLGSIEAGKLADLVVLDADPIADIHNSTRIRWVIKNGEMWDAETMRPLWPADGAAPRFYWQPAVSGR